MTRSQRVHDHAAIGDGRSVALVARDGTVDWLCWPRFDSPSLFAAILDADHGGYFRIAPAGRVRSRPAYLDETNVLVTTFDAEGGRLRLVDFMAIGSEGERGRGLYPGHELLRIATCERGEVDIEVRADLRPGYGREAARLQSAGPLGVRLDGGRWLVTLRASIPLALEGGGVAVGRARLRAGQSVQVSLCHDVDAPAVLPPLGARVEEALARTVRTWRGWARRTTYGGPHRAEVVRSALVLKLLSYAASGAIVAAPTTSLPERPGGPFNWDYRYCWLRDAALTVRSLLDLGHRPEAEAFVSWLLHATRLSRPELRVLYDVHGESPRAERELGWLRGHLDSGPVRAGNAAASQLQLDGYGEVTDALAQLVRRGWTLDGETQALVRDLGEVVCRKWSSPDAGIWERRGPPSSHVHSLALCWAALDRILELNARGVLRRIPAQKFAENRALLRRTIETRGWNGRIESYVAELGGGTVDCALLQLGWYGYRRDDDPRMRATWRRIDRRLSAGGALLWRDEQGRADREGAFGACSFWAASHLARAGRVADAEQRFERLLAHANDVGLYGEEMDPVGGEAVGNFPQAFTHSGLIDAALAIEEARAAADVEPRPATGERDAEVRT